MVSSLLDQVIYNLENHSQTLRFRKLIVFACTNTWENDRAVLQNLNLKQLLQTLLEVIPTAEQLQTVLYEIVETLNKKSEYLVILSTLIEEINPLYLTYEEPTINFINFAAVPVDSSPTSVLELPAISTIQFSQSGIHQLFLDARVEMMKYANPLRLKIIFFSVVEHPFSFSKHDWPNLKRRALDDWLHCLLQICPTATDLEQAVYRAVQLLPQPEQYLQVARVILEAMKPLYRDQQTNILITQIKKSPL